MYVYAAPFAPAKGIRKLLNSLGKHFGKLLLGASRAWSSPQLLKMGSAAWVNVAKELSALLLLLYEHTSTGQIKVSREIHPVLIQVIFCR